MRLATLCLLLLVSSPLKPSGAVQYFQFGAQDQGFTFATSKEQMNFATLNSNKSLADRFSICGSMWVGFSRGRRSFISISKEDRSQQWFTIYVDIFETKTDIKFYATGIRYPVRSLKTQPRIHDWIHACVTFDTISGWLQIIVDRETVFNRTVEELKSGRPMTLQNTIFLGLVWKTNDQVYQSTAPIGNVQFYNECLKRMEMESSTKSGIFPNDAVHVWDTRDWTMNGNVTIHERSLTTQNSVNGKEVAIFPSLATWDECYKLCSGMNGRIVSVPHQKDVLKLKELTKQHSAFVPTPFNDIKYEGQFENIYNGEMMDKSLFAAGEPDQGRKENCVALELLGGTFFDIGCERQKNYQCFCEFDDQVRLRLRGLCSESFLDYLYTVTNENQDIVFKGFSGTEIYLNGSMWKAETVAGQHKTMTEHIFATKRSYLLGTHVWTFSKDSADCSDPSSESQDLYRAHVKMTSCQDGEFTCWDGECISIEQRCDQVMNCQAGCLKYQIMFG